jgi:hypothetical protein
VTLSQTNFGLIPKIGSILTKEQKMKKNMSNSDRVIRLLVAALFAGLYFGGIVPGTLGLVLVILGGVFVLTSLVGFCPLYTLFGISTKK